jgi:putative spermidine/putrescine transport system permease protein
VTPLQGRLGKGLLALLVAALCALPFAWLALASVAGPWPFPDLLPSGLRFDRWGMALRGEGGLGASFAISLLLSTIVAAVSTACGFVTARHIAYHRQRRRLLLLAYVPFALSPVILGVCLLYVAIRIGLAGTFVGVVLAQTIFAYGFAIVFFLGWWTPATRALEDLVHTLGGEAALFRRVLVPLARGMLLLCFFQTFLISWFQYGLTQLIGGGVVKTLPLKVYDFVFEANPAYAALAGCLLAVPPVALLWINKRFLFKAV